MSASKLRGKQLLSYATEDEIKRLDDAIYRYIDACRFGSSKEMFVAESRMCDIRAELYDLCRMRVGA